MQHAPQAAFATAEPEKPPKGNFHYWKKHLMTLAVSQCKPLTGNATKVMVRIIAFANETTGLAWPSIDTLADETGFSRKVVKAAIADAEKHGLLTVTRSAGGRHGETHTFRPAWDLAVVERGPSRDRVRGPYREATGSLQGTDGVPVGHGRGPSRDPEQIGGIRVEEIREEDSSSDAHAREAAAAEASLVSGDRPSRGGSPREPVIPLPVDFAFDPVDIEAAIARGHTSESVDAAGVKLGKHFAGKRKTLVQWREAGRKWIGEERPPQADRPDPNEMVRVGDLMNGFKTVKRCFLKPGQNYTDSKGNAGRVPGKSPHGSM